MCIRDRDGAVAIDFVDNGDGIPMEARDMMFEKFSRLGQQDSNGAGLGLAICREIMHRLDPTATLIRATGKSRQLRRHRYEQIETPDGLGWVEARFITDQIDSAAFAADPRPGELLEELVDRLRSGRRLDDLLSESGLFIVHHGEPIHAPKARRMRSPEEEWPAANPAGSPRVGTFREIVAPEIIDAFDDPERVIEIDRPLLRSTRIPTEFANLRSLSVGRATGRKDRASWMVFFDYDADHVSIVGLLREA